MDSEIQQLDRDLGGPVTTLAPYTSTHEISIGQVHFTRENQMLYIRTVGLIEILANEQATCGLRVLRLSEIIIP